MTESGRCLRQSHKAKERTVGKEEVGDVALHRVHSAHVGGGSKHKDERHGRGENMREENEETVAHEVVVALVVRGERYECAKAKTTRVQRLRDDIQPELQDKTLRGR